jgi:hypothetical protein
VEGMNSSMIYLLYSKNFCECQKYTPTQHDNKKYKWKKKTVFLNGHPLILGMAYA